MIPRPACRDGSDSGSDVRAERASARQHDAPHVGSTLRSPAHAVARRKDTMATSSNMKSVDRALDVLYLLGRHSAPLSARQIAEALELPKSTTHHLLNVMMNRRFVAYLPNQRAWALGVGSFEVGSSYMRSGQLALEAQRFMPLLANSTSATAHLAVLQGTDVIYLDKREPADHAVRLVTDVGARLPAHLTAVGRALLSSLDQSVLPTLYEHFDWPTRTGDGPSSLNELRSTLTGVASCGYAIERGLTTTGITCIASPVVAGDGTAIAALGIAFLSGTKSKHDVDHAVDKVIALSGQFSTTLGWRTPATTTRPETPGIA